MIKKFYKLLAFIFSISLISGFFAASSVYSQSGEVLATYKPLTNIGAPPAVIARLDKGYEQTLMSSTASQYPQSVIIKVNNGLQVIGSDGKTIGQNLTQVYSTIKDKVLAVIEIDSQAAANSLSQNFIQLYGTYDIAVMSKDFTVVKKARDLQPKIRGIWDASEEDLSNLSPYALANLANKNKASVIVLAQSQADTRLIDGLLAKLKGVWVIADTSTEKDIYTVLTSGAYGIICDNYSLVYNIFSMFGSNSILRSFQNIGHRGLPSQYAENTMSSFIAAYENGATHIELDAYLCKSGELVVMHDDKVDRTTSGTGFIYDLTLTEIRNLSVLNAPISEKVPTLQEVFDEFLYEPVIITLEFKGRETVGSFNYFTALKTLIDSYAEDKEALLEQLIVISFSDQMLGKLYNNYPEIPTGQLGGTYGYGDDANFYGFLKLISGINAVPNSSKGDYNDTAASYIARGYPLYYYTYYTSVEIQSEVRKGTIGITNDMCGALSQFIRYFDAEESYTANINEFKNLTYEVIATNYIGEINYYNASVFKVLEESQTSALVILQYSDAGGQTGGVNYTRYTTPVSIILTGTQNNGQNGNENNEQKSSLKTVMLIIGGAAIVVGASIFTVIYKKRKRM